DLEQPLDMKAILEHHGQAAVLRPGRLGDHAIDNLPLKHEVEILAAACEGGGMEQEGRGHVVGQVAHHPQGRWKRGEVKAQGVPLVHAQPLPGMTLPESLAQIPVDLDHVQVIEPSEQREGQRSEAGSDLDDVIVCAEADGCYDSLDVSRIDEKMLADPLPRGVTASRHSSYPTRCASTRAIASATSTASIRLWAPARPVPAMSIAVPWSTDVRMMG